MVSRWAKSCIVCGGTDRPLSPCEGSGFAYHPGECEAAVRLDWATYRHKAHKQWTAALEGRVALHYEKMNVQGTK